jgi:MYXO-CTERM domain-containing protein
MAHRHLRVACAALLLAQIAPSRAVAENLVVNPEFDADADGWSGGAHIAKEWQAEDVFQSAASGSVAVINEWTIAVIDGIQQCFSVSPGSSLDFGGWLQVPAGQPATVAANIQLVWRPDPGCEGTSLGSSSTPWVTETERWIYQEMRGVGVPPAAQSASLNLNVLNDTGASVEADFDSAFLAPSGSIFEPAAGDLVIADGAGKLVKVDPANGVQRLLASGDLLGRSTGVALARDGSLYATNQFGNSLIRVDPRTGSQTAVALSGDALDNPRDVDAASDGTLWVVGRGLWKITLGSPASGSSARLLDLDDSLATSVQPFESGGHVTSGYLVAGVDSALGFDVASSTTTPYGVPTAVGRSAFGIWAANPLGFFFTEIEIADLVGCNAAASGLRVFSVFGQDAISLDGEMRCPRAVVGDGSAFFVTDAELFFASTDGKVVRIDGAGTQTLVTRQGHLGDPWDVELAPEPDGAALAGAAVLAALTVLRRRREQRQGSRSPHCLSG